MTITEQKAFLSGYQGLTRKPQKSLEERIPLFMIEGKASIYEECLFIV